MNLLCKSFGEYRPIFCLVDTCLESLTQIDGGLICPKRQCVFTHNPIQQISYNDGQKKNVSVVVNGFNKRIFQFNEIGASIMALDANCTEQLVVFSSTWHKIVDIETGIFEAMLTEFF